ncbi:MAG: AAA family ATPase [Mangrovibacterium sp.]
MQLKRLYIKDYKLFKDFTYEFPCDSKRYINVLIGINGSGKSTILEVIADIFSCVVLGEKAKFGFELEYLMRYESTPFKAESGLEWSNIQYKEIHITASDKGQKPELLLVPEGEDVFYKAPGSSKYLNYIPQSIVIYYSGYSEIMKSICEPHNKRLSDNLRKGESLPVSFYYHESKFFNIILLSLLSYEYGDIPVFLREKSRITGVESIQIKLKEPYWADSGSIMNDFWGASGGIRLFLDFLCHDYTDTEGEYEFLDYNVIKSNILVEEVGYERLFITINGINTLFVIKEFLGEERSLFEILRTMYHDDLLDDICFSLMKNENGEQKTFSILSEGEQQAITIKGLTELLADANTLYLFDEPDTFLHPKWQRNFIREIEENVELQRTKELNYLIATHSPQILSNANPEKTYVKIIEDGQLVDQTPKHYGREIGSILYNLMGVEERNETIRNDLSNLFMLIEDEEIEEAEKELERLTAILGDTDADIQNATLQINYLKEDEADH